MRKIQKKGSTSPTTSGDRPIHIMAVVPHELRKHAFLLSQVRSQFAYHESRGRRTTVVCLAGERMDRDPLLLEIGAANHRAVSFWRIGQAVYQRLKGDPVDFLYARDIWGGVIAWLAKLISGSRAALVYDFRGAVPEEILFEDQSVKGHLKAFLFRTFELFLATRANRICCVTEELGKHLKKKYGVSNATIVPCCTPDITVELSAALLQSGRLTALPPARSMTLVYLGGLARWQNFDRVCELVDAIVKIEQTVRLRVVTQDRKKASDIVAKLIPHVDCEIVSASNHEVPAYLIGCAGGFLLRDSAVVNEVAFPIKFAEYLACGVPVIISSGLTDVSRQVRKHRLGVVLDLDADKLSIAEEIVHALHSYSDDSARLTRYVNDCLTWQSQETTFRRLYSTGASDGV